jgi:hypothetical protein
MWVGMAGPLTNFVLAVVFAVAEPPCAKSQAARPMREWLFTLLFLALQVNVVLGSQPDPRPATGRLQDRGRVSFTGHTRSGWPSIATACSSSSGCLC